MKTKVSIASFVTLLLFLLQFSSRAQTPDCYDIQCPSKIFAPCEGVWGAHVWFSVIASNSCNPSAPPTVTYSVPPGSVFPPGTNIVCAAIQIPGLPARRCCFEVIVDRCCSTNCVEVICPKDIVVDCRPTPLGPGAMVSLPPPQATNHCGDHQLPSTFVWKCIPQTPPNQPIFFPPGTNTVVWCLTDGQGYMNCCCFNVIVTGCPTTQNDCRPQIICPTDIQVQCEGTGGGFAFFPPPKVIDPCHLVTSISCTRASGTFFPNGKTTVVCCITWRDPATGAEMNDCCCFDVIVRCCPPPCVTRLDCPTNIMIDCPSPNGIPLNYFVFGTNTCEPTKVVCEPPPGTIIFGATNVCCKLLNSSGVSLADCCFKVTVNDTVPPVIDCPPDITVISPNCQPVPIPVPIPVAFDNCDPNPTVTCTPVLSLFPCGTTVITCIATDASGNTNRCSFKVTVICGGPEIICPPDIFTCSSPTGVVVNYSPTATNRCTNIVSVICVPPSGTVFLPGSYAVCCRAIDANNEVARCCFKVTVVLDDIPPRIVCPSNIVVISPNCTPVDVPYPLPQAVDNCQLDYVKCTPPPTVPFPIGVTTVKCCAFDKAGNSDCCSFTVTVRCPNDCVRIVCPTNILVDCAGPNGAVVTYDAHALNFCTGQILPVTCSQASGTVFPPGITTVCCTNVPSAASAPLWCCFDVKVRPDLEPPVINCSSNIYILCANPNGARVKYDVTATDNCDPAPAIVCVPPSGSKFPLGCTNVTCTATDNAGNSSTCTFKVCVLPQGCYLRNPSFELLSSNLPAPLPCGDPIGFALGWSALSGTPDLFRPPFASFIPGNCRGREEPCQGTNYAGLEGGYTSSGGFATEEMMGTLIAPLNNGQKFRLRACLSLADTSPGPVLLEFVLANSANLAQQQVIHQVLVTQKNGWIQYQPPCFGVPDFGTWDRLIIRAAKVVPGVHPYPSGYVYVDNVNICCCKPRLHPPDVTGTTVVVTWEGPGQLQAATELSDSTEWHDVSTPVEENPDTGEFRTKMQRPRGNLFFRVLGPDGTVECSECGG